jgi:hypothetical protein
LIFGSFPSFFFFAFGSFFDGDSVSAPTSSAAFLLFFPEDDLLRLRGVS